MKTTDKKLILENYMMSGLWITMCGYIVIAFIKELFLDTFLVSFSIDLLVAVFAFYIALFQCKKQRALIKKQKVTMKPFILVYTSFAFALVVSVLIQSPFDISFLILVIGNLTSQKMFKKELENCR